MYKIIAEDSYAILYKRQDPMSKTSQGSVLENKACVYTKPSRHVRLFATLGP